MAGIEGDTTPPAEESIFAESEAHLQGFIDTDPYLQALISTGASRDVIRSAAYVAIDRAIERADIGYVETKAPSSLDRTLRLFGVHIT